MVVFGYKLTIVYIRCVATPDRVFTDRHSAKSVVIVIVSMSLTVALQGAGLVIRDEIKRRSSIGRRPVARGAIRRVSERRTRKGEQRDQAEEEQLRGGQTRVTNDSRIGDTSEPCSERVQIAAD